jgi:hypothetical protein
MIQANRGMKMRTRQAVTVVRGATGEARHFETMAEAMRFIMRRGDLNELWRIVS